MITRWPHTPTPFPPKEGCHKPVTNTIEIRRFRLLLKAPSNYINILPQVSRRFLVHEDISGSIRDSLQVLDLQQQYGLHTAVWLSGYIIAAVSGVWHNHSMILCQTRPKNLALETLDSTLARSPLAWEEPLTFCLPNVLVVSSSPSLLLSMGKQRTLWRNTGQ